MNSIKPTSCKSITMIWFNKSLWYHRSSRAYHPMGGFHLRSRYWYMITCDITVLKIDINPKCNAPQAHCWKYFSPRSNFGTKNQKLGSDNPFVLSMNFKNHLDLVCQFLDWQWSKLLDKGSNHRIPNSKYMTIVALIQ